MDDLLKSVILTLVAMAPGIIALLMGRRKAAAESRREEADASEQITQSALSLVEPLKKRITELEEEVAVLRQEIRALRLAQDELICGNDQLIKQIESLGKTPIWRQPASSETPTVPIKKGKKE